MGSEVVVTFDLFSALIDSRTGAASALQQTADSRGWPVTGAELYDVWDRHNKELQRNCRDWVPYRDLAAAAMAGAYEDLGLRGDPSGDAVELMATVSDWPLWPDVEEGLALLHEHYRVGLLSNVDTVLFARTRAYPLVDATVAMTSEKLRAYKPDARIYHRARDELSGVGPMVHVASSARDVRGALQAGVSMVRLRREGHALDPEGPTPAHEAGTVAELHDLVRRAMGPEGL